MNRQYKINAFELDKLKNKFLFVKSKEEIFCYKEMNIVEYIDYEVLLNAFKKYGFEYENFKIIKNEILNKGI